MKKKLAVLLSILLVFGTLFQTSFASENKNFESPKEKSSINITVDGESYGIGEGEKIITYKILKVEHDQDLTKMQTDAKSKKEIDEITLEAKKDFERSKGKDVIYVTKEEDENKTKRNRELEEKFKNESSGYDYLSIRPALILVILV